jgi:hypothetical protein
MRVCHGCDNGLGPDRSNVLESVAASHNTPQVHALDSVESERLSLRFAFEFVSDGALDPKI